MKWLAMWPLSLLLFFTVPNCGKRRWERWFMVSFFTATIWIAGLSYIMVWMVSVTQEHHTETKQSVNLYLKCRITVQHGSKTFYD